MKVAVIMGSKSDLSVVLPTLEILKKFGVEVETRVISAHRTPEEASFFARHARENGFEAIIAAAGKAAHLGGVLAAYTTLPVIGLPVKSSMMDGLDSLLSTVQMPGGVPVATVAVGGGLNAGLLAIQILSVKYTELADKMADYKKKMAEDVKKADSDLKWEELL